MKDIAPQLSSRIFRSTAAVLLVAALCGISAPAGAAAHSSARSDSAGTFDAVPLEFYLESARAAYHNQQWEIAEMEYQNVLLRESTHLAAIIELADVYERLGKYEHARGLLSRASALDRNNKKLISRALELDQKLCRSLHSEVDTLLEQRSYDLALPKLALLMTLEPENPDLYYQKSYCCFNLSRYDIALAAIETALRLRGEPSYHDLHHTIIDRMKQLEIHALMRKATAVINPETEAERQSALTLLARIIELDPDNAWAKREFLRLSESDEPPRALSDNGNSPNNAALANIRRSAYPVLVYLGETLSRYLDSMLIILAILLVLHSPLTRSFMKGIPRHALLSGELSRFTIAEVLTMIGSHNYSGKLVITGGPISGKIYFDRGEAYHCTVKQAVGREALRSLLNRASAGRFYFTESRPPVERTIDVPLSLLIMDLPEQTAPARPLQPRKRAKSKISELLENR